MFPLRVTDLEINIKSKRLIGPINLEIEQNGISILLGANGSGKTTLLEALHGLRKLSAGKVEWTISHSLAAKEQAFVFQSPIMLRRTVAENLAFPLKIRRLSTSTATVEAMTWAKKIGRVRKPPSMPFEKSHSGRARRAREAGRARDGADERQVGADARDAHGEAHDGRLRLQGLDPRGLPSDGERRACDAGCCDGTRASSTGELWSVPRR